MVDGPPQTEAKEDGGDQPGPHDLSRNFLGSTQRGDEFRESKGQRVAADEHQIRRISEPETAVVNGLVGNRLGGSRLRGRIHGGVR